MATLQSERGQKNLCAADDSFARCRLCRVSQDRWQLEDMSEFGLSGIY